MARTRNQRAFQVVQFIELPFEGIDDYVCVPYTWLTVGGPDQKALVKYPKDEDPFDTRDRVKRKERYNDEWESYVAIVKYESDTYRDAEYWIATRNDYEPLVEKESKVTDTQPRYSLSKKLRSAIQNHLSKSNIPDSGIPTNFRPQIDNVRSLANVHEDRKLVNEVSSKVPIQKPVEKRIRPIKIEKNLAIAAQNPSNLIEQTRSLLTRSVEQPPVVTQNQSQKSPQVPKMHTGNSTDQTASLRSITISSQDIQVPRINIERSIVAAVDPSYVLQSATNVAASSQQLPSSSHKHPSYVRRPDGHQKLLAHEQYYTHSHPNQYLPTNQGNFKQELLREPLEGNSYDHRPTTRSIKMRIPSIRQNLTLVSNPIYQTSELPQQRQSQPNQQDSQRQPQRLEIPIGNSIKTKDKRQMPTLQGVTKKTQRQALSTTHNNFILSQQQLQPRLNTQSTEDNNIALMTSPQNIAASVTSNKHNSEIPIRSFYQSTRIQHTRAHENVYQNQITQEQLVDQFTRTKSTTKRVHFIDDVARSPVTGSHLNVMDNACQTNAYMVEETLSPHHAVTLDSDAVTDHEVISDHEMTIDETPVEASNNFDCTANNFGCSSAIKPTAAQNSISTNHQTHLRVILEQQMLDDFAILDTQMRTTLHYTCDMHNNLRDSILVIAETYKKLLGAVERFNAAENAASNAVL